MMNRHNYCLIIRINYYRSCTFTRTIRISFFDEIVLEENIENYKVDYNLTKMNRKE